MKNYKSVWNPFALRRFKKDPSVMNAVDAINEYAHAGKPIPLELLPELDKACLAYEKREGRSITNRRAAIKRYSMVHEAHLRILEGEKKNEAFEGVARWYFVDSKTVERYYNDSTSNEAKLEARRLWESL